MAGKPPIRIPLAVPYSNREVAISGSLTTDTYLTNCYIETQPDGRKMVVKRPGLSTAFTYNAGGATNGQGTAYYQGMLWAMGSNVLYNLTATGNGSTDGGAWTASTNAPWVGRAHFGSIIFNGQILILGGENTGGIAYLNDVWGSSDGVTWTQLTSAAPWAKRRSMGLAVLGSNLYLIGGDGSDLYNDVWATGDGVNWVQVIGNSPWGKRIGMGVCSFNQGIFLMGGHDNTGVDRNDVWFTPDGATWVQMVTNASWSGRYYFSLLTYQNKMWVFGGNSGGAILTSVYSSPDGITWTNTGNLPGGRELMASCVYGNKMWLLGGYDATVTQTSTVWRTTDGATFTVATAAYGGPAIEGASLVPYRTPTSVSTINAATMWLFGGHSPTGYLAQAYRGTLNVPVASSYTPTGTGAATTDQWQNTTQNAGAYIIWKNNSDAWVYWAGQLTRITSTNYPTSTVPGVVNLDDTIYVMDINGVISGSNLSDPFTWSSLNFIVADFVADIGIAVVKYKNMVMALKSTSTQFFYDAGRYPGSPLLPIIQYNMKTGCLSAAFVVNMMDTVVWIARSEQGTPFVAVMDGMGIKKISTPAIDRILLSFGGPSAFDTAFAVEFNGHYTYVFVLGGLGYSFAYDFQESQWWIIRTGTSVFGSSHSVSDGVSYYLQDMQAGRLYQILTILYQDSGQSITSVIQTSRVDGGNNNKKFTGPLTVIGDRKDSSGANNLTIQWSDDDAQTFNTGQTVDITLARPKVNRNGSFRRRTWKLTHSSNNPMRLEALELSVI